MPQPQDLRQPALAELLHGSELPEGIDPDHLEKMRALARSDAPALSRDHYFPGHFTASAFVLNPSRDSLLLIRHKKLGMWLQPGGHIEAADRDVLVAAKREVEEETGLSAVRVESALFDLDVHEIPAWRDTPAHLHHDIRVLLLAQRVEVQAADDAAEARWFFLEKLVQSKGELAAGCGTDESVRRVAKRLLTLHHM